MPRLILASASPARLALLRAAGLDPEVLVSGVDEDAVATAAGVHDPSAVAATLARAKAEAVLALLRAAASPTTAIAQEAILVGCDTVLEFDGAALGKPLDAADATARWRAMRGRSGVLRTGHHLIRTTAPSGISAGDLPGTHDAAHAVGSTVVHFADLTDDEIDAYVATGEPLHVAGAFTIDGRGGAFVDRIEGDHGNVVGISLPLMRALTAQVGVRWTDLWTAPSAY